jgi:hypothetical protein
MENPDKRIVEVELEKVKCILEAVVPQYCLMDQQIEVSVVERWAKEEIMTRITGYVWGEYMGRETIRYPADWWQGVKERWFPGWVRRHWPVRYTEHVIDFKAMYPDLRISLPDEEHFFVHRRFMYDTSSDTTA